MTLRELILELNPIIQNRYTHYKSRSTYWSIKDNFWYVGDHDSRNTILQYYDSGSWKAVAEIKLTADNQISCVEFFDTIPIKIVMDFKEKTNIAIDVKEQR